MSDRLRQISAFLHVATARNFTRAGEAMGLSQPALSLLIMQFEDELGLKLFDRTTRTVTLTEAGHLFLPRAEQIVQDVTNSIDSLKDIAALMRGRIRIGALPSLCSNFIPGVAHAFLMQHPKIELDITEYMGGDLVNAVAETRCEIGIGVEAYKYESLRFSPLFDDNFVLLCHREHPFADRENVFWRDLPGEPFIAMRQKTSVRELIEKTCENFDISLSVEFEVSSMASGIGMVEAGLGVTILPSTAQHEIYRGNIVSKSLSEPTVLRHIGLLQRSDRLLSPAAQAFATMIAKASSQKRK